MSTFPRFEDGNGWVLDESGNLRSQFGNQRQHTLNRNGNATTPGDHTVAGDLAVTGDTALTGTLTVTGAINNEATTVVSMTATEIKALRAAPKTLVAAPGASSWIEFVSGYLKLTAGSEALTESSANLGVKFENGSGTQVSENIEATGFIDQTSDTVIPAAPAASAAIAATNALNKALVLHNLGAGEYGGNASDDSTLEIAVTYRVHSF
jgi:hypothetical protein